MTYRILIMGLPGSGKTTLSEKLTKLLKPNVLWLNADEIRAKNNDWDFSDSGRLRQATRIRGLSDASNTKFVIADFVCPLPAMREIFGAHYVIWVDTIDSGRFEDTNKIFIPPSNFDIRVTSQQSDFWANKITNLILKKAV